MESQSRRRRKNWWRCTSLGNLTPAEARTLERAPRDVCRVPRRAGVPPSGRRSARPGRASASAAARLARARAAEPPQSRPMPAAPRAQPGEALLEAALHRRRGCWRPPRSSRPSASASTRMQLRTRIDALEPRCVPPSNARGSVERQLDRSARECRAPAADGERVIAAPDVVRVDSPASRTAPRRRALAIWSTRATARVQRDEPAAAGGRTHISGLGHPARKERRRSARADRARREGKPGDRRSHAAEHAAARDVAVTEEPRRRSARPAARPCSIPRRARSRPANVKRQMLMAKRVRAVPRPCALCHLCPL